MTKFILGRGLQSLIPKKILPGPSLLKEEKPLSAGLVPRKDSIYNIEINKVVPSEQQPRQRFYPQTLKELADSIKEHGILQPLLVSKVEKETENGRDVVYQIIAGERRWRAAQIAGLVSVPVIIRDSSAKEKLEVSLIENVQREDLNAIEKAKAYNQLHEEFGLSHDDIARRVGKNRPTISNTIRLLNLPNTIQQSVESGQLTEAHARALLTAKDENKMMDLYEEVIKNGLTVRQVEDKARISGIFTPPRARQGKRNPTILAFEKQLTHHFGSRVSIRERENAGRLMIDFYSKEELDHLIDRLVRS